MRNINTPPSQFGIRSHSKRNSLMRLNIGAGDHSQKNRESVQKAVFDFGMHLGVIRKVIIFPLNYSNKKAACAMQAA